MHAVHSNLHHKMKYVYNDKIYQIEIYHEPKSCLQVEKGMASPLNILIPTSNIKPTKESKEEVELMLKLLGDDKGSLDFTQASTSTTLEDQEATYTTNFDEVDYEQPTNLKEMEKLYIKGYKFINQFRYSAKGCGAREHDICVPIEPSTQGMTNGLGYSPFNEKKESNKYSPNINTIKKNSSKPTLTLVHLELIDISVLDFYHL